jgi:hypothetical protein
LNHWYIAVKVDDWISVLGFALSRGGLDPSVPGPLPGAVAGLPASVADTAAREFFSNIQKIIGVIRHNIHINRWIYTTVVVIVLRPMDNIVKIVLSGELDG